MHLCLHGPLTLYVKVHLQRKKTARNACLMQKRKNRDFYTNFLTKQQFIFQKELYLNKCLPEVHQIVSVFVEE